MASATNYQGDESPTYPRHPIPLTGEDTLAIDENRQISGTGLKSHQLWIEACKHIFPVYLATHIVFLLLTYLASLFALPNFSHSQLDLQNLITSWDRWDTGQFTAVATQGYDAPWRTAFFPLFPLLEAILKALTHNTLIAGLIVANLALFVLYVVLYRLVKEDFHGELAARTVLYLALFPTAFFLASAYNESLFMCFSLLSFYHLRRRQWWWAGLFGMLATLTRSAGIALLMPFVYEYLRQHDYRIQALFRFRALSGLLIPTGLGIFAIYCAIRFQDPLAFSHAQSGGDWQRQLALPGIGFARAFWVLTHFAPLSFSSIHTVIDLSAGLLMLLLTVLCFVGPWRFKGELRVYAIYMAVMYLFLILFPSSLVPLQSLARQVIELFPAFILIAIYGKKPQFNLHYLIISGSLLAFMLLQFLTGYWIV